MPRRRIEYYFPQEKRYILKQLHYDHVSLYSVTRQDIAHDMAVELHALVAPDKSCILLDTTACIGGNTLAFSRLFHQVYAVEINAQRYGMLVHNMSLFDRKNINFLHMNSLEYLRTIPSSPSPFFDVIFMDPPWGGRDYHDKLYVDIELDGLPVFDIMKEWKEKCLYLAMKLPLNFNMESLRDFRNHICLQKEYSKMQLIVFQCMRDMTG